MIVRTMAVLLGAYLLGALPVGYLIVKWIKGVELTRMGSGHTGGTNALRVAGSFAGGLTVAFDFAKGLAAVLLAERYAAGVPGEAWVVSLAGLLAVVGHNYSVFLRFNGGVGTMTSLGAGVALMFSGTLAAWGLGFALILVTRYASVGSLIIAAALPVACLIGALVGAWPYQYLAFALGAGALSIYALRANIARLRTGTERKVGHRA
ncbi:MAG: glycerol-3-phosphate acyltransferase [Anaerolineae bacterium]|jgi:glycerol-3-phosphate acyltransferase PlsY